MVEMPLDGAVQLLRVHVTIVESVPEIWRDVELDPGLTLDRIHEVLQRAFGWRNLHLHQFLEESPFITERVPRVAAARRWTPEEEIEEDPGALAEESVTLGELLTERSGPLFYEYDFGDGWTHRLDFLARVQAAESGFGARAIDGENQGPLEDSGGPHGYAELLHTLADDNVDGHEEMSSWAQWATGPWREFAPETCDLDSINTELELAFGGFETSSVVRALTVLTDRLCEGMRPELRTMLRGIDRTDTDIDDEVTARMVAPYSWLLRRVGVGGVKLSSAGWLPPPVVHEAMTELGWIEEWWGAANREEHTGPIRDLRESAQTMRLVQVRNGVLAAPKSGARLIDDPKALWTVIAQRITLPARTDPEHDATLLLLAEIAAGRRTADRDIRRAVAWGMGALGWLAHDEDPVDEVDVVGLALPAIRALEMLGALAEREPGKYARGVTPEGRAFAARALNELG